MNFFKGYIADPMMIPYSPFTYNEEMISRSYQYNYFYQTNYAHFGIFVNEKPVGCLQLKRIDTEKQMCEFGIILQNDQIKNRGIGTAAIREAMRIARNEYQVQMIRGDTSSENKRMIRVFDKLNFNLIEEIPGAFILDNGRKISRLVYEKEFGQEER